MCGGISFVCQVLGRVAIAIVLKVSDLPLEILDPPEDVEVPTNHALCPIKGVIKTGVPEPRAERR